DPEVAIGSDGSPSMRHPRGYGSFARIIEKYVVNEQKLSMPQAIYKMTGKSADILGLTNRGRIAEGMKADILIFDPKEIHERANWASPHETAAGFNTVVLNGKIVVDQGKIVAKNAGQVLRKGK
nr:amidohydrolase family protein [Saprospiraceae bacterium]